MLPIQEYNKIKALHVLSTAFQSNPSVLTVVKKDKKVKQRIYELCFFCLNVAMQKGGAYITKDSKGVALIYKSTSKQSFFNWLKGYLRLGQLCIGWDRAWGIIKRDQEIQRRKFKGEHLYFWMLAVEDQSNGLNTIIEIRDFTFQLSKELQLPICAETSVPKALRMYQRYGFQVYDQWYTPEDGNTIYFIRRDWTA